MRPTPVSEPARPRSAPGHPRGFTLIEMVMVIAITGVVVGLVAVFIAPATTAYFNTASRAQLSDQADTALRRIGRDLAIALPNSVRILSSGGATSLELIPVSGAARYATESGDPLVFGAVDASFSVVGPGLTLSAVNQRLAFYNLGPSVPDADAYTLSNVRTVSNAAGTATTLNFSSPAALPVSLQAPPFRVYAIEQPVTYRCDPSAGTLTRYRLYGFNSNQVSPPAGATGAVLARNVSACSFSYDPATIAGRYALVSLQLSLTANGETVTLYQAVHVDNLP